MQNTLVFLGAAPMCRGVQQGIRCVWGAVHAGGNAACKGEDASVLSGGHNSVLRSSKNSLHLQGNFSVAVQ